MERSTLSTLKKHGGATLLAALACAGAGVGAHAAELGDASVRSFIGQPLEADIELVALAPDEQNLQVVLASPNVYKGANIAMNPALNSLSMSVTRGGGRQFLHITSARPIDADHLNLFLELIGGGRSAVRATTVWLTAAPAPLVKPAPLPAPTPTPVPVPVPASALSDAAGSAAKLPGAPAPVRPPVLAPRSPTRVPMNCSRPELGEEAQQCIDLARKNAALSKKLVELEGKVKALQEGVGLPAASAATPAASAAAAGQASAASASAPAPAPRKLKPLVKPLAAPAKPVEAERSWPLTLLGGAAALLLLMIGGGVYWWRRRKQKAAAPVEESVDPVERQAAPVAPPRAGLLSRLFGRKKSAMDESVAEPTLQ